jgi:acetyl-CoA acetyltransferase
MSRPAFQDQSAITGIGWTEFSRESGRTVLALATEASLRAIGDAGLRAEDIDGIVTYFHNADTAPPRALVHALGLRQCHFQVFNALGGGWACAAVGTAAMAVHAGVCQNVLIYRAMNGQSEHYAPPGGPPGEDQWRAPFGVSHAAARFGPFVTAHMARFGTTSADLGLVAVTQRAHAALNAKAMLTSPLTLEEHQRSPWLIWPFRRADFCLRSDAAVAIVVSSAERARDLRHAPVLVTGFLGGTMSTALGTQGAQHPWQVNAHLAAPHLYGRAGVRPEDVDFAELYDPFSGMVLLHLEGFGLTAEGEAAAAFAAGRTRLDGDIPVNTHGGLLSEAYTHGLGHVIEAVQQLRPDGVTDDGCDSSDGREHDYDRAHCRQVREPKLGLVCGECGDSSLLLRAAA